MTATHQPAHATTVAQWAPGRGWRAALLYGPPGTGKSDLALRLIGQGWRLVSDDYTHVFASGGALYARAPETIAGRIEARGVGIVSVCTLGLARVVMAVELSTAAVERLPDPESQAVEGVALPLLRLDPHEASTAEKVAAALARL
jgi:serine kinase of HPr protein (carbohydrate metabolism regulator)